MQQFRAHTFKVPPGQEPFAHGATWHSLRKRDALPLFAPGVLAAALIIPDEILLTFTYGGAPALVYILATLGAIALFIALTLVSWHRSLVAYPASRGDYHIASANLGPHGGLLVGCARILEAFLYPALCLSAATALVTSTLPALGPYQGIIACLLALTLLASRLRPPLMWLRRAVTVGALAAVALLVAGFLVLSVNSAPPSSPLSRPAIDPLLGIILIAHASTSAGALLGGLGATANACPDFRRPHSRTTITTLSILAGLSLATLTALTLVIPALSASQQWVPGPLLSHLATTLAGTGTPLAALLIAPLVVILISAANTSLNSFPALIDTLARDSFLPHYFRTTSIERAHRTTSGLLTAAALAITLALPATMRILPLYLATVLLIATAASYAMIRHWNHHLRQPQSGNERRRVLRWRAANVVGFMAAGILLLIVAITRFMDGVWISLVVMGTLFAIQRFIRRHYDQAARYPDAQKPTATTPPTRVRALIIASTIDAATWHTVTLAQASTPSSMEILTVADPTDHGQAIHATWEKAGSPIPLTILDAPNRDTTAAILTHLHHLRDRASNEMLMVYLPEILTPHTWGGSLHNHDTHRLARKALAIPGVLTVTVPWTLTDTHATDDTAPQAPPPNNPFRRTPPRGAHTTPTHEGE